MAMSKRHFEKLAAIIRNARVAENEEETANIGYNLAVADIAQAIADMCCDENPRFDRERFLAACEPK